MIESYEMEVRIPKGKLISFLYHLMWIDKGIDNIDIKEVRNHQEKIPLYTITFQSKHPNLDKIILKQSSYWLPWKESGEIKKISKPLNEMTIKEGYLKLLKKYSTLSKEKDSYYLGLPFPLPSGDQIKISIKKADDTHFFLSDDGFMDEYFFAHGQDLWDLTKTSMKEIFNQLIKRHDILKKFKTEIVIKVPNNKLSFFLYEFSELLSELSHLARINMYLK